MRFVAQLLLTLFLLPQPALAGQHSVIAFENVQVRTMDGETLIETGFVVTRDGRIVEVGKGELPADFAGQRIDGAGGTLIPGLADMHVHHYETDLGAAYLANGITLVRNLTGSLGTAQRDAAARAGTIIGPRVKTSGPILDGGKGYPNDFFIRARTPGEAIGAVRSQARSGYEAIKLYEQLDGESFRAAVGEARANGMKVYAHVPADLDIFALLEMKIDSLEHLDGYAEAMAREGFSTERDNAWAERWANVDRTHFSALASATAQAGSWTVPTFAITYGRIASADPGAYFARPEARVLPLWADSWSRTAERYAAESPYFERSLVERIAFVRALKRAGANILIGTDAPNPFVTPGYAIHNELAAFAQAGFSNFEILHIATVEAARFLNEKGRTGTIAAGAPADLVLLESDPVDDLAALRQPLGTMVSGHWHSRADIDAALDKRAARLIAARQEREGRSSE